MLTWQPPSPHVQNDLLNQTCAGVVSVKFPRHLPWQSNTVRLVTALNRSTLPMTVHINEMAYNRVKVREASSVTAIIILLRAAPLCYYSLRVQGISSSTSPRAASLAWELSGRFCWSRISGCSPGKNHIMGGWRLLVFWRNKSSRVQARGQKA